MGETDLLTMRVGKTLEARGGPPLLRWTPSSPEPALLRDNPATCASARTLPRSLGRRIEGRAVGVFQHFGLLIVALHAGVGTLTALRLGVYPSILVAEGVMYIADCDSEQGK